MLEALLFLLLFLSLVQIKEVINSNSAWLNCVVLFVKKLCSLADN